MRSLLRMSPRRRLSAPRPLLMASRVSPQLPLRAYLCGSAVLREEKAVVEASVRTLSAPPIKPHSAISEKTSSEVETPPDESVAPLSVSDQQYETLRQVWQRGVKASADFKDDEVPVFIAIDTESWEMNARYSMPPDMLCKYTLELGWSIVVPKALVRTHGIVAPPRPFNSLGGNRKPMVSSPPMPPSGPWIQRTSHFLTLNNYPDRHNGKYVADNRDQFLFGTNYLPPADRVGKSAPFKNFTRIAKAHEAAKVLKEAIKTYQTLRRQVFLVFHDTTGDLPTLRALGFDTSAWLYGPPSKRTDPSRPPPIRILDTVTLFSLVCGNKARVSLKTCALALGVNGGVVERMHNAGNDAWYTGSVLATMLSGPPLVEMRKLIAARLDEATQLGRKAVNGPNSWKQPLVLESPSSSAPAVATAASKAGSDSVGAHPGSESAVHVATTTKTVASVSSSVDSRANKLTTAGISSPSGTNVNDTDAAVSAARETTETVSRVSSTKQSVTQTQATQEETVVPLGSGPTGLRAQHYLLGKVLATRIKLSGSHRFTTQSLDDLRNHIGSIATQTTEIANLAANAARESSKTPEGAVNAELVRAVTARVEALETAVRACNFHIDQTRSSLQAATVGQHRRLASVERLLAPFFHSAQTFTAPDDSLGLESHASLSRRRQQLRDQLDDLVQSRALQEQRKQSDAPFQDEPNDPPASLSSASRGESLTADSTFSSSKVVPEPTAAADAKAISSSTRMRVKPSTGKSGKSRSSPSLSNELGPSIKSESSQSKAQRSATTASSLALQQAPEETFSTELPPEVLAKRAAKTLRNQRRLARRAAERERGRALRENSRKLKHVPRYTPVESRLAGAESTGVSEAEAAPTTTAPANDTEPSASSSLSKVLNDGVDREREVERMPAQSTKLTHEDK